MNRRAIVLYNKWVPKSVHAVSTCPLRTRSHRIYLCLCDSLVFPRTRSFCGPPSLRRICHPWLRQIRSVHGRCVSINRPNGRTTTRGNRTDDDLRSDFGFTRLLLSLNILSSPLHHRRMVVCGNPLDGPRLPLAIRSSRFSVSPITVLYSRRKQRVFSDMGSQNSCLNPFPLPAVHTITDDHSRDA